MKAKQERLQTENKEKTQADIMEEPGVKTLMDDLSGVSGNKFLYRDHANKMLEGIQEGQPEATRKACAGILVRDPKIMSLMLKHWGKYPDLEFDANGIQQALVAHPKLAAAIQQDYIALCKEFTLKQNAYLDHYAKDVDEDIDECEHLAAEYLRSLDGWSKKQILLDVTQADPTKDPDVDALLEEIATENNELTLEQQVDQIQAEIDAEIQAEAVKEKFAEFNDESLSTDATQKQREGNAKFMEKLAAAQTNKGTAANRAGQFDPTPSAPSVSPRSSSDTSIARSSDDESTVVDPDNNDIANDNDLESLESRSSGEYDIPPVPSAGQPSADFRGSGPYTAPPCRESANETSKPTMTAVAVKQFGLKHSDHESTHDKASAIKVQGNK